MAIFGVIRPKLIAKVIITADAVGDCRADQLQRRLKALDRFTYAMSAD
jgi:hypothetical protein